MRLVSFVHDGQTTCGVLEGDQILVDPESRHADLKTVLESNALPEFAEACAASGKRIPLDQVTLLPVIPTPGKILCVGHNYEEHRQETGRAKTAHPSLFVRFADTLIGHEALIVRPPFSTSLDFEGELAVVIGRGGFRVPAEQALDLVAGYSCFNDGSVRDWQWHTQQFTPGKNFPSTGAFGPTLVTPDEVGALDDLTIQTRLNGEVVQSSTLGHMIFPVAEIIAYVSSFTRLSPGDVIATGTPGGVGAKRQPPVWLKPGDVVEIDIAGVGVLRNGVVDEAA
ncbi:fumarylacetoacetate hydrolase family protein [Microvirga sp. BT688]|uniref:fumarylacetoacetate hydrolase family protein n=1 Tax=Microvirga sp. TaxID=1873136 RepID=UPI0016874793|nr:fumarylacetoacetate hydrolase family protein [Microvirga sp.]MBD2750389.1 fumarylacetoacetate hydrolase family protein [Microvirga sp.]